jgi:putative peptide zinc metalloprotease protein
MNVLFPRIPIWDPDRFLRTWMPVAKVLFSKIGALIWLVVITATVAMLLPRWNDLKAATQHSFDLQHNWENLIYLYGTFIFIKLIHELGHAFACRRFGGECHELGIMLLVLVPTPYVDASTAWAFPSKWQRMFVGCAGMIVELFFASICAFVWMNTNIVSSPLINQLAYNAMFIASVSTLMFNANPLLRYDGYYILSDWLEIPNLRQRSSEYGLGLIKRHIFRLKSQQSLPPLGQRFWLLLYAIASSIYRVFVGVMIVLVVTFKVPVLGVLMAIGGVVTWLFVPMVQVLKYVLLDPELHRKRIRAIIFTGAVTAGVVVLVGLVKFPVHVKFEGIVQPDNPVDETSGKVISGALNVGTAGRVVDIKVKDNDDVEAGQVIVQLANEDIDHDVADAQYKIDIYKTRIAADRATDQTQLKEDLSDLNDVWIPKLKEAKERQDQLTVRAPFSGRLIAPHLDEMANVYLNKGQNIGSVAVLNKLVIRGDIDQKDVDLAQKFPKFKTEVRMAGLLGVSIPVPDGSVTLPVAAVPEVPHPSLTQAGGGEIMADPHDPKGRKAQTPQFEARVKVNNPGGEFLPGQRAYVQLTLDRKPLIWQWSREFLQLVDSHDTGRWL